MATMAAHATGNLAASCDHQMYPVMHGETQYRRASPAADRRDGAIALMRGHGEPEFSAMLLELEHDLSRPSILPHSLSRMTWSTAVLTMVDSSTVLLEP